MNKLSPRHIALMEVFFCTFISATTFVLVKMVLEDWGPLTITGVRYMLAFSILWPFTVHYSPPFKTLTRRTWLHLIVLGISVYTIGNGAMFWGLQYLPATSGSFLLNLLPLLVLVPAAVWLKESPTRLQLVGVFVSVVGSGFFFYPALQAEGQLLGMGIVSIGLMGFVSFAILGRALARAKIVNTWVMTAVPLAFGGGLILLVALWVEGIPPFHLRTVLILLWMAVVNTAVSYMLYNHALQLLTTVEINVMQNIVPMATAVLAWFVLDESLVPIQIAGMVIMMAGVAVVQAFPAPLPILEVELI